MSSESKQPLTLRRETVKSLPESDLAQVAGGTGATSTCPPPPTRMGDPDMPTGE